MLWIRALSGLSSQPLAGTEGATSPFWSPDSRYVAFVCRRPTQEDRRRRRPSDDDCGRRGRQRRRLDPRRCHRRPGQGGRRQCSSPRVRQRRRNDSRRAGRCERATSRRSCLTAGILSTLATTQRVRRVHRRAGQNPCARRSRERNLRAGLSGLPSGDNPARERFDVEHFVVTGEPVRLAERIQISTGSGAGAFSVSEAGTLVYQSQAAAPSQLTWFDADRQCSRHGGTAGRIRGLATVARRHANRGEPHG